MREPGPGAERRVRQQGSAQTSGPSHSPSLGGGGRAGSQAPAQGLPPHTAPHVTESAQPLRNRVMGQRGMLNLEIRPFTHHVFLFLIIIVMFS